MELQGAKYSSLAKSSRIIQRIYKYFLNYHSEYNYQLIDKICVCLTVY